MSDAGERALVMVSYYFPPLVGIASERASAMTRHLPELGWTPVVVAPEAGHFHRSGREESLAGPEGLRVIRTRNPEVSRLLRRLYAGAGSGEDPTEIRPVATGPGGGLLRKFVHEALYMPDAQVGWIPFAAAQARREVERWRGRCILFSSSVPYSSHLAAWWVARRTGTPWVAEFRDPWTDSRSYPEDRSKARHLVDSRLERDILLAADHIVVTSRATENLFLRSISGLRRRRLSVVMNGFEPRGEGDPPPPDAPLRLVYGGTLHQAAHAVPLLRALAESAEPVRLHVYGPPHPWKEAALSVPGSEGRLSLHGLVEPEEVPKELLRASALVLLDPEPEATLVVRGKLLEYLGARRPILAAIPPGSEMEALIQQYGELVSIPSLDVNGVQSGLAKLLDQHRQGTVQVPTVPESQVLPLTRRAQVQRLAGVLDRVHGTEGDEDD